MKKWLSGLILGLCLIARPIEAATYYIDFSGGADTNNGTATSTPWKHVKGMVGCTNTCNSTTISGGDTVVFKGGVTWQSSFPWTISGGAASAVIYTTDHSWFSGGAFAQPVFDDEERGTTYTSPTVQRTGGWITLNDLKFYRCGVIGTVTAAACFLFDDAHDMTITNNTFDSRTWFTFYFRFAGATGTFANFTFTGNDWTNTTAAMWIAAAISNVVVSTVSYHDNTIHDFASMIGCTGACGGGGAHGDGFLHWFNVPGDTTSYIDGFDFYNNRSYGDFTRGIGSSTNEDMTAFLFLEGPVKNYKIFNNDFGFSPLTNSVGVSNIFDGLILFKNQNAATGSGYVVNNTFHGSYTGSDSGSAALRSDSDMSSITIKNNAIEFSDSCYYTPNTVTGTSDYNNKRCPTPDVAGWPAEGSHSIAAANVFVSSTDSHIQSSSPNRSAGQDLTSLGITALNSDRDGIARPSGSAWDIGAYQYAALPPASNPKIPRLGGIHLDLSR